MTEYGELSPEEKHAGVIDSLEPSMKSISAKRVRERRGDRGREGKTKKKSNCSEHQTTNAGHGTKILKTMRIGNNKLHILAAPTGHNQCTSADIDSSCADATTGTQRRKRELHKNLYLVTSAISRSYQDMHKISKNLLTQKHLISTMITYPLHNTQFDIFQKVVIWRQIIVFRTLSPNLLFFSNDQCRHNHVTTFLSLNCCDSQVHRLCPHWTSIVLIRKESWQHSSGYPCILYRSGLPVFYTLLRTASLLHASSQCLFSTGFSNFPVFYNLLRISRFFPDRHTQCR